MTGSLEGDRNLEPQEASNSVTKLTQLLCSLCRNLESHGESSLMPAPVQKWWKRHKALDEATKRDNLRAQALAKLTPSEKKILGLT